MIVVDASVALKWVLSESDSAKATALQAHAISAPSIWLAEAANTLWRYVRMAKLDQAEALVRFRHLTTASVTTWPIEPEVSDTLSLAIALDHPIYDCFYLTLAVRESTYVVTADARFASVVRKHGKWSSHIKLLSET